MPKNENRKKKLKIIAFSLLSFLLLHYFCSVFQFKNFITSYMFSSFYDLKPNTVDVVFLGSSHVYTFIDPGILYQEYGIAGFDFASETQPVWNSYFNIKETLKTQKPRLIVLECYTAIYDKDYHVAGNIVVGTYGMRLSRNKIEAIKTSDPQKTWVTHFLEYPSYHNRYNDLKRRDFYPTCSVFDKSGKIRWNIPKRYLRKGYLFLQETVECMRPDTTSVSDTAALSKKNEIWLKKIIELSKQENIPLLLIVNPYVVSESEMKKFNRVAEIAKEYGIPFVNYNFYYDEIGLDFAIDCFDRGHTNYRGAEKMTRYLGNYLKENYDLPDRRGQREYDTWNLSAQYYEKLRYNQKLRETLEFSPYLQNANVEKNMVLYVARGNYKNATNYEDINLDQATGNTAWVMQNGKIIFASQNSKDYCWHTDISFFDSFTIQSVIDTSALPDEDGAILAGAKPSAQALAEAPVYPQVKYNTTLLETLPNGISIFIYDTVIGNLVEKAGFAVTSENVLSEQKQGI